MYHCLEIYKDLHFTVGVVSYTGSLELCYFSDSL